MTLLWHDGHCNSAGVGFQNRKLSEMKGENGAYTLAKKEELMPCPDVRRGHKKNDIDRRGHKKNSIDRHAESNHGSRWGMD